MEIKEASKLFVSPCGRVFKELKQFGRSQGAQYKFVNHNGGRHDVHRLVATAWLENPENKPLVMHLDDNPSNNHVSNLRWGSYQENSADMIAKGRHLQGRAQASKLWVIKRLLLGGLSQTEMAKILNVTPSRISQLLRGYRKTRLDQIGQDSKTSRLSGS